MLQFFLNMYFSIHLFYSQSNTNIPLRVQPQKKFQFTIASEIIKWIKFKGGNSSDIVIRCNLCSTHLVYSDIYKSEQYNSVYIQHYSHKGYQYRDPYTHTMGLWRKGIIYLHFSIFSIRFQSKHFLNKMNYNKVKLKKKSKKIINL